MKKNLFMASSLESLNLAGNKFEPDGIRKKYIYFFFLKLFIFFFLGSAALASFLASPNTLRELIIPSTTASLETIFGALIR